MDYLQFKSLPLSFVSYHASQLLCKSLLHKNIQRTPCNDIPWRGQGVFFISFGRSVSFLGSLLTLHKNLNRGAFLTTDIPLVRKQDKGKKASSCELPSISEAIRRKWPLEKCCDTICHRLTDTSDLSPPSYLPARQINASPPNHPPLTWVSHEGNKNGSSRGSMRKGMRPRGTQCVVAGLIFV